MPAQTRVLNWQSSPRSGVSEGFTDNLKPDIQNKKAVPFFFEYAFSSGQSDRSVCFGIRVQIVRNLHTWEMLMAMGRPAYVELWNSAVFSALSGSVKLDIESGGQMGYADKNGLENV